MNETLYAIRHKQTGDFMPLLPSGRGYSHWEPGLDDPLLLPRFFHSAKAASTSIVQWARGKHIVKVTYRGFDDDDDGDGEEHVVTPVPGRSRDHLEVVECHVTAAPR